MLKIILQNKQVYFLEKGKKQTKNNQMQNFKNTGSQFDERVGTYFLIPVPTEVNGETVTNRLWHYTECKC